MSRIGNRILQFQEQVKVELAKNNLVTVQGPKGILTKQFSKNIAITIDQNTIKTERPNNLKQNKQLHGTTNSLLQGMIIGVSEGFTKKLTIQGVGYRANLKGENLELSLGFSHPVVFAIPTGVTIVCPNPITIIVSGIDKQLVGQVAAKIREFKKPEPYKGKGIRYENEFVIRKEGKKAGK